MRYSIVVLLLLLPGCAHKPWTTPLSSDDRSANTGLLNSIEVNYQRCAKTVEADLLFEYENTFGKKLINGFFQYTKPSSFKFVVTNPFGQPVFAVAGNQQSYKSINVPHRTVISGSLKAAGIRNNIPDEVLHGKWDEWLNGSKDPNRGTLLEMRNDKESRGLWLTYQNNDSKKTMDHLLIGHADRQIQERILEDFEGKTIARIVYTNWVQINQCQHPLAISISELSYNTVIRLTFSDLTTSEESKTYTLPTPPGFSKTYLP